MRRKRSSSRPNCNEYHEVPVDRDMSAFETTEEAPFCIWRRLRGDFNDRLTMSQGSMKASALGCRRRKEGRKGEGGWRVHREGCPFLSY